MYTQLSIFVSNAIQFISTLQIVIEGFIPILTQICDVMIASSINMKVLIQILSNLSNNKNPRQTAGFLLPYKGILPIFVSRRYFHLVQATIFATFTTPQGVLVLLATLNPIIPT